MDLIEDAKQGNIIAVRDALEKGVDIELRDNDGYTALIRASKKGHTETVKLLIEKGADVNATEKYFNTPLMFASLKGYAEIVKLLLENGANVSAVNIDGLTAATHALNNGYMEIVKILFMEKKFVDYLKHWNEEYRKIYAPLYELADEFETILNEPKKLRQYFNDFLPILEQAIAKETPEVKQLLHLANGLRLGILSPKEKLKDEDIETIKKDLINLPLYLDLLIDNLTKQPLALFGFTPQWQTDEYRNRVHLVFGLMMVSSVFFKEENRSNMFDQFDDLSHKIASEEFAIMFGLSELYGEEWGRRIINK